MQKEGNVFQHPTPKDFLRWWLFHEIWSPIGSQDTTFFVRKDLAGTGPLEPLQMTIQDTTSRDYPAEAIELPPARSWGGPGNGPGLFAEPRGVATDTRGIVYVADTKNSRIEIFDGPRCVAVHKRCPGGADTRVTDPDHRPPRGQGPFALKAISFEEQRLSERAPESTAFVEMLKKRGRATTRDLRTLLRMLDEYPRDAFRAALQEAQRYGMADLDRLERMVLRRIARDFFVLPGDAHTDPDDPEEDDDD
jgi:hypothetical protein